MTTTDQLQSAHPETHDAELDALSRDHRRRTAVYDIWFALRIVLGVVWLAATTVLAFSADGWLVLARDLFYWFMLSAVAVPLLRRGQAMAQVRRAFRGPRASLGESLTTPGRPLLVEANLRRLDGEGGPFLLLTDPRSPQVVGFIADPAVEIWGGRTGRPRRELRLEELWSDEGVWIAGCAEPARELPPGVRAHLDASYREPPRAVRFTASRSEPLRVLIERV